MLFECEWISGEGRKMLCRRLFQFCLVMILAMQPLISVAEISNLNWELPEIVDAPVSDISSSSGASVLWAQDSWHVVYEKAGNIYHRMRDNEDWYPVEPLTDNASASQNPHLAYGGDNLHVVWEDDRTGHLEVWTRRWSGSTWTPEECLTCDDSISQSPVIAGDMNIAYVAWEEVADGQSQIHGRRFEAGGWLPAEIISASPVSATEPALAFQPGDMWGSWFDIVWIDDRHGESEIYHRMWSDNSLWWDEERLTDLPGSCRRPSIHSEFCCGDAGYYHYSVVFENDQTGVAEVYQLWFLNDDSYVLEISQIDGIVSNNPNFHGFNFPGYECDFGGDSPRYFAAWSDQNPGGGATHQLAAMISGIEGTEIISSEGLSVSAVGTSEGSPRAPIMVLWIEEDQGQPTLFSKRGDVLGCFETQADVPPSLLLAPEGIPENVVHFYDICTGNPLGGYDLRLRFMPELDAALTWDPLQTHPVIEERTDSQGEVAYSLRGGGCSTEGFAWLGCWGTPMGSWGGAKSPDVDGNCIVDTGDLAYVESFIGSDDFCADLDGSGLVDESDVAIVQATLWDHCSNSAAVDELPGLGPSGLGIRVWPYPSQYDTNIQLDLPNADIVQVEIIDVSGRRIRAIADQELPAGRTDLIWDLRDNSGRGVPSGIYYVKVRSGRQDHQRSILVLR
ncbi:MAG: FlgD immunoglobulin-like domain containing protein [Candidatus Latescibacterota bacterium]